MATNKSTLVSLNRTPVSLKNGNGIRLFRVFRFAVLGFSTCQLDGKASLQGSSRLGLHTQVARLLERAVEQSKRRGEVWDGSAKKVTTCAYIYMYQLNVVFYFIYTHTQYLIISHMTYFRL